MLGGGDGKLIIKRPRPKRELCFWAIGFGLLVHQGALKKISELHNKNWLCCLHFSFGICMILMMSAVTSFWVVWARNEQLSYHSAPSRSKLIQSNHEERNNFNISHQSGSQNLLASESDVVPSTYTLSQAVNNLEDIPVVEAEKETNNSEEITEEPVDTQGLARAINSIGENGSGPVPGPSRHIRIAVPVKSSKSGVCNLPSQHPQPEPSQSSPQNFPLPTLRKGKRRAATNSADQDKNENSEEQPGKDESNYDVFDFSDTEPNANLVARSASPTAPPKTGGCPKVPRSGTYWAPDKIRGEGKGKGQEGIKKNKGVEAHVGFSKGGEVHMVVGNLPCDPEDIDSEDIELVRTGRKGHRKNVRIFSTDSDESVDIVDASKSDEDEVVRRVNREVDTESTKPGPVCGKMFKSVKSLKYWHMRKHNED